MSAYPPQGSGTSLGDTVELSEQATISADTLLGRANGAGTGIPQALTLAQALALLGGGVAPTGTGELVRATGPTLVTPALGTPASGVGTNLSGIPLTGLLGWEAVNGCSLVPGQVSELLTIAAAAFTDSTTLFTAGDIVFGPFFRVTTAIPTATTFDVGVAGQTTRFGTGISVAVNTTNKIPAVAAANGVAWIATANALAVRVTPNGTPVDTTGRLRIVWFYLRPTVPTS